MGVFLVTKTKFLKLEVEKGGNPSRKKEEGSMGKRTLFSKAQIPKEEDGEK